MYWLYILECEDGSLYTGISVDADRRLQRHAAGDGARYTRSHKPVRIVYREEHKSKSAAARREAQIKGWNRKKKLWLISQNTGG